MKFNTPYQTISKSYINQEIAIKYSFFLFLLMSGGVFFDQKKKTLLGISNHKKFERSENFILFAFVYLCIYMQRSVR